MTAKEAWYIDDGVVVEGILIQRFLHHPVFFPRDLVCGFFSQKIFRNDIGTTLFMSEEAANIVAQT